MLLLGTRTDEPSGSGVWTARTRMCADAEDVLSALTDPAAIAAWAPVRFEVDGLAGSRLQAGSRERVTGSLAGIRAAFEIEVLSADYDSLELVASGPVELGVSYRFFEDDDGVIVEAAVRISRQRGLSSQLLAAAVSALLNAGALRSALRRIEDSLGQPAEAELVFA